MRSLRSVVSIPASGRRRVGRSLVPFAVRLQVARLRARAVRHRLLWRGSALLAVGIVVFMVAAEVQAARRVQAQWGETVDVVVVGSPAPVGSTVDQLDLVVRPTPQALVPGDALQQAPPTGDHLVVALRAGDVLTARDLSSSRRADRSLPDGFRAIGVAVDAATPAVEVGDRVDIIVLADPFGAGTSRSSVLQPPAVVVDAVDDTITLGVPAELVGDVLAARADGRVSLAVR